MCEGMMLDDDQTSEEIFLKSLVAPLCALAEDKVPNVRLELSLTLAKTQHKYSNNKLINSTIQKMKLDKSRDVCGPLKEIAGPNDFIRGVVLDLINESIAK
jgi:hypothetical protein